MTLLEQRLVDLARQEDCLAEVCDLIDYDPDVGRVPEHWRVQPMLLRVFTLAAEQPAEQKPFGYLYPTGTHPEFRFFQNKRDGVDGMPVYTAPQPAIPHGYKLVPVEPTPEMLAAPENAWPADALITYRAMLNAAPKAPHPTKRVPLTREHVRESGGIVHSDGNVFFTSLDQLNSAIDAAMQEKQS